MNTLKELRDQIDKIDDEIICAIANRMKISIVIGKLKKQSNAPIYDLNREINVKLNHSRLAKCYELNDDFISQVFNLIMLESKSLQS